MKKVDQAERDYQAGFKYKEIAAKYGVSINTVSSWKKRHGWCRNGAPKKKNVPNAPPAPKGNQYAKGTRGGRAPLGNHNAVKHGLFAKYLPVETAELMDAIERKSAIDILWDNICIKHAAILRAQKIMYVEDAEDFTKRTTMDGTEATAYQYTEAWDKQAAFLNAQSRAMGTLNNMIRQYEEMCRSEMTTEEHQLRIDKLKAEVDAIKDGNDDNSVNLIDDLGSRDE